ncbi:hypothetical protein I302_104789 [Kwoniella bestiolae CBS 10118]|uniref:Uncharacterized protein n=1 Tax=Kwoniella bestiolae CBS 10118 TaxID=1296100 RepID=A0A1B9FRR0_9TREE|nr:hypothetical protein I302_09142 [Kwoniella bestiolae CBS 10118]OCF21463.1 hypothetical protein I302_09142 [Kwoniella bestiolae CBS 10118]
MANGKTNTILPGSASTASYLKIPVSRLTGSLQKFLNMEKHYAKIIKGPSRKCEREFRKYANKALGDETERTHALTSFKEACASVMEDQCRDFLATYRKLKDEASEYLIVDGMIAPELEEEIIRGLGSFPYRPTKRHIELLSTECRPTITSIANMIGWIRKNLPEDGNLDSILASVSPLMREVHALHTFATSYRNSNLNDIEADRGPERGTGDKTLPTEAEFDVDPSSDQQDSESELEYSSATDLEDY